MADPQPLVFTSLHLPPDPQPFLRIHQVALEIFLPNMDRLRLTLEAIKDINPEPTQIFFQTRKVAREQLHLVFKALHSGQEVAERYFVLLEALSERKPTQDPLRSVNLGAKGVVLYSKGAQPALAKFRGELESAVGRVSTAISAKHKKGSKASLTSPESTQLVLEIIGGIDECNALLKQCQDQFASLAKQTQDENSIESNPPSEEEIQVARAQWQTYLADIGGLWAHGHKIATEIQLPSRDNVEDTSGKRKQGQSVPLWRSLFQRQEKDNVIEPANAPKLLGPSPDMAMAVATPPTSSNELRTNEDQANAVDSTEALEPSSNAEAPPAAPSNTPSKLSTSFWQKLFRPGNKSARSTDVSGGPEASDGAPDTPFWKKFTRWATCLSTKPISS